MEQRIEKLLAEVEAFTAKTADEIDAFRVRILGRKGELNDILEQFKNVASEQKRILGQKINTLKTRAQMRLDEVKATLAEQQSNKITIDDMTRSGSEQPLGSRHPISIVRSEIIDIFSRIGFVVADGPEIEDDWHVFSALNFAPEHPARDMQDTFFIQSNPEILLRTHTSSVQVRVMEHQTPPIRVICPGRVFRNEAISYRSHCIFHQIEGLYIDKGVSFADLKQTLLYFAKEFFGEQTKIRLRPSYFPFTEPSAEMDVSCNLCGGKGCPVCKGTGWLEVLGCGMVHPNVLKNCGIDPNEYSGFAFGGGIERSAMMKFGVKDIRLYFENDTRFLEQFESV